MKKSTLLSDTASDLRKLADHVQMLGEAFAANETVQPEPPIKEKSKEAPAISLEEVRAICAEKSGDGFDVPTLIKKYGAARLSKVDPEKYPALIADLKRMQK